MLLPTSIFAFLAHVICGMYRATIGSACSTIFVSRWGPWPFLKPLICTAVPASVLYRSEWSFMDPVDNCDFPDRDLPAICALVCLYLLKPLVRASGSQGIVWKMINLGALNSLTTRKENKVHSKEGESKEQRQIQTFTVATSPFKVTISPFKVAISPFKASIVTWKVWILGM